MRLALSLLPHSVTNHENRYQDDTIRDWFPFPNSKARKWMAYDILLKCPLNLSTKCTDVVTLCVTICGWTRWKTHLMDLRQSCQHCYNHVWTRLDKYGPAWTSLDPSVPAWTSLDQSGWVWTSMIESGQVWTSLDESGWVWTSLGQSGLWYIDNHLSPTPMINLTTN